MDSNKLTVGFIGAGGMAHAHMKSVSTLDYVSIGAICDLEEARAVEAASEFGGKSYSDYIDMLGSEDLDAVYVCTPPFAHGDLEMGIIERGIPFLVEKPVALDLNTALRIRDAVEAKGLMTSVGYQLRYLPSVLQTKASIAGRKLGMIVGRYWSAMITEGWWAAGDRSGGQIVEQATHVVDLMRDFGGEIVEVDARAAQRGTWPGHVTVPDVYSAHIGYESGALGQLSTTCMLNEWKIGIDIMVQEMRLSWKADGLEAMPADAVLPPIEAFPEANIDDVFLAAVKSGERKRIRSDYADGVRTLAVTLAANESAEKGAPVKINV
jgi:myo-inositol 2-dehydrogenase / D-chiro-inositol 1-dehydrogenase